MRRTRQTVDPFEILALCHLGIFLVGATWLFGGEPDWVRELMCVWGTLGAVITACALLAPESRKRIGLRPLLWLWPLGLFNLLVFVSCRTPSYREIQTAVGTVLAPLSIPAGIPSTPEPAVSLRALWLFDAIYLSAFNVLAIVRVRRALRGLLLAAVFNALALAVFGTLQRLVGATGLYFGLVPSPRQPFFFASFFYHNHWAAYSLLMIALCLGLAWHYRRRAGARGFVRTPGFVALLSALFLAVTEPMSASRSGTLLLIPVLAVAGAHWLVHLAARRRQYRESARLPILGGALAALLAGGGIWYLGHDIIAARIVLTRQQLVDMHAEGGLGSRSILYRDTWRMARARLAFGWGMGSYPRVFLRYNSQLYSTPDGLRTDYYDAHNDWFQAAAEHGLVGSALIGLTALVPLAALGLKRLKGAVPLYLMAGCALILLYAWMEFPFANPAVVVTWWVCFFSAIQHARLSVRTASPEPCPAPSLS